MVTVHEKFDLGGYTTFHIPAVADMFVEYDTTQELVTVLERLKADAVPVLFLGGGSNMLFAGDYHGAVLHCRRSEIEEVGRDDVSVSLRASAGTVWDDFVKYTVDNGLYGAENLSYIPGNVGGAAVQNVGAYGAEAKDIITGVEVLDTVDMSQKTLTVEECRYGYRDSIFKHLPGRYVVTDVLFRLSLVPSFSLGYGQLKDLASDPSLTLAGVRDKVIEIRRGKLPEPDEMGSAGSFFKNPVVGRDKYEALNALYPGMPHYDLPDGLVKIPAGWLIENAGLKGCRIGGALVYPRQCLVIVNASGATSGDVISLMNHVVACVREKYGISITPEVNIVGI